MGYNGKRVLTTPQTQREAVVTSQTVLCTGAALARTRSITPTAYHLSIIHKPTLSNPKLVKKSKD